MDELLKNIEAASEHIEAGWTDARRKAGSQALVAELENSRRRVVWAVTATVVAAAAVFAVVALREPESVDQPLVEAPSDPAPAVALPPTPDEPELPDGAVRFSDGSHAIVAESTELREEPHDTALEVHLDSGQAEFHVVRDPRRVFRVRAGTTEVEVLGTVFTVERDDDDVEVRVLEGRVQVAHDQETQVLGAGDSWRSESHAESTATAPRPRRAPDWRAFAHDGEYDAAHEAIEAAGASAVRDEPSDLLLAADAARLSGHPRDAVRHLVRVEQRHRRDPRAALASFTLGRIYLYELGRAREAAAAFARARQAQPRGSLAQDALAREVEALSRAGDRSQAAERAQDYLDAYPQGRHVRAVRRHGGVE